MKWSLYILEFLDVSNGLVHPPPSIANPVLKWPVLWAIQIKNMTRSLMINGPRSKDLRIPSWELRYPLPVWYFCVDDFSELPVWWVPCDRSLEGRPNCLGVCHRHWTSASYLRWKDPTSCTSSGAQRLAEGFFGVRLVRFVCLGYETQKGGNPSRKLTGCHRKIHHCSC